MSKPVRTFDVPSTFCFRNFPADWPTLAGLLYVDDEPAGFNYGNSTPAAADRDKPWLRTNSDGTPDGWYVYANGAWLKAYTGPGTGAIILWDGLEANIPLLDGGEVAAITSTTGPFWERVTDMNGRFPVGVGTIPDIGTAVAVGDNGGEGEVELEMENIPSHDHGFNGRRVLYQSAGVLEQTGGNDISISTFHAEGGDASGNTVPHANIPPYRGVFFIRRTSRLYHRAP